MENQIDTPKTGLDIHSDNLKQSEVFEFMKSQIEDLKAKTMQLESEKSKWEKQANKLHQQLESEKDSSTPVSLDKPNYTQEEADTEFQNRMTFMEQHLGQPSEEFYWGKEPTDIWAAQYLKSRGVIKTLKEFYQVRREAAANGL